MGAGPPGEAAPSQTTLLKLLSICDHKSLLASLASMQAETRQTVVLHLAYRDMRQTVTSAWHLHWHAQVCDIYGGDRGRAEAAHLLRLPQGALLRAALSESSLGRP